MLLLTLLATLALAACGNGETELRAVNEIEVCKTVKERLTERQVRARFGEPDDTQDFFGDTVLAYEGLDDVTWQFQVKADGGTFRALRVEGSREQIVRCP